MRHTYALSLDPSSRATGCALWRDGILESVYLIRTKGPIGKDTRDSTCDQLMAWLPTIRVDVYTERPVQHGGGGRKADPETLLQMAVLVGRLEGVLPLCKWTQYTKAQWAGTAPKEIVTKRVLAKLSDLEQGAVHNTYNGPPSLLHNVLDAVGVGLYGQGRM